MDAFLPEKFVRLITEAHGAKGTGWLTELRTIVEEIEKKWCLSVKKAFPNLSYHFVASCDLANGGEAVLKIGFPESDSPIFNEAEMLKLYEGRGAVKFLRIDERRLATLLEKLNPGKHLKLVFPDDPGKAVEIAVEILLKIKRKPPVEHNFVRLDDWFAGFEKAEKTIFPRYAVKKAQNFYEELSSANKFLLHGDFHHENILSATREEFLAIDPKGIVGAIGYEIAVFLNNHLWWLSDEPDLWKNLDAAVRRFSEAAEIEMRDLRRWAFVQMVLSAWWTFEENGENWQNDLALADIWDV